MSVKITGLKELNQAIKKLNKDVQKETRNAVKKSLYAGGKEIRDTLKSVVPVMASSTNFRQKGVLKKNIKQKTELDRGQITGYTSVYFSDKNATKTTKTRERNRRTQNGKLKTAPVVIYKNDPYFWHMVDRGTVNGVKAQHFMKKTEQISKDRALRIIKISVENEVGKILKK